MGNEPLVSTQIARIKIHNNDFERFHPHKKKYEVLNLNAGPPNLSKIQLKLSNNTIQFE